MSSAESSTFVAAKLSFSRSSRLAPTITEVTTGFTSSQASATRAALQRSRVRDGSKHVEHPPRALLVDDREVEGRASRVGC